MVEIILIKTFVTAMGRVHVRIIQNGPEDMRPKHTKDRKLTTVHPYRFWPRPLVPIVVLATKPKKAARTIT